MGGGFVHRGISLFFLLAGVFLFPLISVAQGADIAIKDIRIGQQGGGVYRFVLEADQRVPFQVFLINFPERMVIDLPAAKPIEALELQNSANAPITEFRYGLFRSGVTRIVMDVSEPLTLLASARLDPDGDKGHRFYIDFKKSTQRIQNRDFFQTNDWVAYSRDQTEIKVDISKKKVKKNKKKRIIVLDPGHGGPDPGAISPLNKRVLEKKIVLIFAKSIKKILEEEGDYKVILTREKDVFVPLRDRYKIAEDNDADLFISIHVDSIPVSKVRGLTLYTLSEKASDKEAELLARNENQSDLLAGYDLSGFSQDVSSILIDLSRDSTNQESWRLAQHLVQFAKQQVVVSKKPHRSAGFAVLKSSSIPSVLLEVGYMTNDQDLKNLRSSRFQKQVGRIVKEGVSRYLKENQ